MSDFAWLLAVLPVAGGLSFYVWRTGGLKALIDRWIFKDEQ